MKRLPNGDIKLSPMEYVRDAVANCRASGGNLDQILLLSLEAETTEQFNTDVNTFYRKDGGANMLQNLIDKWR